ncbi:MAG TPA: hypothetical protein DIU49_12675, partial [Desulfovibrio sp.]|nr:hypothetical protein [Desulfovibrio sp.]
MRDPAAEAAPAPRALCQKTGVWFGVSLALHAVLLFSLAYAGVFSWDAPEPPLETVVELTFGSLAGPGGRGGDGQMPGGGAGGTAAQEAAAQGAAQEKQPAETP